MAWKPREVMVSRRGNGECCWLAKDSRRVQGALGFGNSMEDPGDIGRAGSVEWVGEHWR